MDFNKLVKSMVEPTLVHFGFSIKLDTKGILEYNNRYLTITMSYDYNTSYEADMTLAFNRSSSFYGYNELAEYFYNPKNSHTAFQTKDENVLIKWLEEVNNFLKDNLKSILDNHEKVQHGLERIRSRQIDAYEKARNDRLLNEGITKYWAAKDYPGLVSFLKEHRGELDEIIRKKYEYALKMTSKK